MSYSSTDKTSRIQQIAYWNIITLSNLHSLSQTILHHPYPQLHTQTSLNWSLFFFLAKPYLFDKISTIANSKQKGNKQKTDNEKLNDQNTFISRSAQYVKYNTTTLDRLNLFKSQYYDLSIVKHQFWTRLYKLNPTSKQAYQCKRLVKNAVWKERLYPYGAAILMAAGINKLTGIDKLKLSRKSLTFLALGIIAELMVRIKRSDKIFYSIPGLPIPQLQFQRQMILRQAMVLDGKINSYDIKPKFFEQLQNTALKQTKQEKQQILSVLGYNVITKQSQI